MGEAVNDQTANVSVRSTCEFNSGVVVNIFCLFLQVLSDRKVKEEL